MLLDLRPLMRGEISTLTVDYDLTPPPMEGVIFPESAHVKGTITDNTEFMCLTLQCDVPFIGECARCLAPVSHRLTFDFSRTVVDEKGLRMVSDTDDFDEDEYVTVVDGMLDIDEQLAEALLLEFPSKLLCSEDCPGLCPKCGKPLAEGDCGCVTKEIDPRFEILKKLLEKDENM
ncbi:MAG: DUF177 domain-containing protein [Ruminococcaceae bacterium]|nr:DUF177 domain-containing protein [Oscillospiraceae bacterium]